MVLKVSNSTRGAVAIIIPTTGHLISMRNDGDPNSAPRDLEAQL
jgi:hypothetical protein